MALLSATAIVLAACSAGTSGPAPGASTPAGQETTPSQLTSTAVSPEDKAKQVAIAAYKGMWEDFVAAGTTSDWQSPKLGQHATGVALTNLTRGLYSDHYKGWVTKGQAVLNPSVSSVEPPGNPKKVIVNDCGDSTNWLKYRKDNGQLADDKPGGRHLINAIVEKQADETWKVSDYAVHDVGTC